MVLLLSKKRFALFFNHYWGITNGAKLGDATVARAPPLLCNPRNFIVQNGVKIPRNSPSPSYSAPALFRALWRQWI